MALDACQLLPQEHCATVSHCILEPEDLEPLDGSVALKTLVRLVSDRCGQGFLGWIAGISWDGPVLTYIWVTTRTARGGSARLRRDEFEIVLALLPSTV